MMVERSGKGKEWFARGSLLCGCLSICIICLLGKRSEVARRLCVMCLGEEEDAEHVVPGETQAEQPPAWVLLGVTSSNTSSAREARG